MKQQAMIMTAACFLLSAVFSGIGYSQSPGAASTAQTAATADVNVNGVWESPDWGKVILNQSAGSREITGEGDGWRVDGTVDGKKVKLSFSHKRTRRLAYSAELEAVSDTRLEGRYDKGMLRPDTKGKKMVLTRPAPQPATGI